MPSMSSRTGFPRYLVWAVLLLVFQLLSVSPGFGQVSVVPLMQEVTVNRGGKTRFQLQVANRSAAPLALTMHVYDLDISEEGVPWPIREEVPTSCKAWITFTPKAFELAAGQVQVVDGVLEAPTDAVGGYYGFITCEFDMPVEAVVFGEAGKSKADVEVERGVSSTLLVTVRSSKNTVELEPDSLDLFSGKGPQSAKLENSPAANNAGRVWQVVLPVTNSGNVHTKATGEVSIWTENARLVEKAPLSAGRGYLLPAKRRLFRAEGTKALADGLYLVRVQLRTREGKLLQGSFPYSIIGGKSIPGAASDGIRALLEASAPRFSLSAMQLEYKITGGGTRTRGLMLTNHTSDTLSVYPRLTTWTLDDSGKVIIDPPLSEHTRSCASWITVSPNPISLAPQRGASALVTVVAPQEIDGEYYACVTFETSEAGQNLPAELELARSALIMVSSSSKPVYEAAVKSFDYKPVSPMMRAFVVNVVNTGNVHCYVSGKVEIYDSEWKQPTEPVTFGGPYDYVLPGKVRGYVVPCPGSLKPGNYEAVVQVECAEQVRPVVSKVTFYASSK
jgi:hypothetical protein